MNVSLPNVGINRRDRAPLLGFTLIELTVAIAITAILLVLTVQILGQATLAIRAADAQSSASSEVRSALDRFAADFSTAMLSGGATAIFHDEKSRSNELGSQLAFLSLSRARENGTTTPPRGAIIGYAILPTEFRAFGQTLAYPTLHRGDGRIDFDGSNSLLPSLFTAISQPPPSNAIWNAWEPVGTGILRFHVSFLLDDGSVVQTPPKYSMVSAQSQQPIGFLNNASLAADRTAIAFSKNHAATSNPHQGRYVVALVVAAVGVDEGVLAKARSGDIEQAITALGSPADGELPLTKWQSKVTDIGFLPLRQDIRLFQRTVPIPQ